MERDNNNPIIEDVLTEAIERLNPALPKEEHNEALHKLKTLKMPSLFKKISSLWSIYKKV